MNEVWLIGKVEKIEFRFCYRAKIDSISKIRLKIDERNEIECVGYDKMADWIYYKIKEKDRIWVEGKLMTKGNVEITRVKILKKL